MTENIKQVLLDFFQRKSVDYSILINGAWGAGKTYFVNNSLSDVFNKAKLAPVYVSLNGIGSFEEVATQIVFGTNWNGTKCVAKSFLFPFALKYLPEKSVSALITFAQKISEKKSKGWFGWLKTKNDLSPSKHVIIIDDIERVSDPDANLASIMGRIFDEFISKGYHVVFIGVESHIKSEKYHNEKEKYIRRTIKFIPDIDCVVDQLLLSYSRLENRHAKLCSEELKQFAKACSVENVRTMKRILDDFVYMSGKVGNEANLSKIAKVLFYRIAPIANEMAAGFLKPSDDEKISALKNIQSYRYAEQYERLFPSAQPQEAARTNATEQKSYMQYFIKRYDGILPIPWVYDECVIEYEIGGDVDVELFKKTVQGWLPVTVDKYRQSLDLIWGYDSLDDAQFFASCPVVMEGIKNGMYSAEWVMLACGLLSAFTKRGWIDIDCEKVVKDAVKALKKRWSECPDDYINPMLLHNRQEDFLRPIVDAIREESIAREKKSDEEDVSKFLTALTVKDKESACAFLPTNQSWQIFDKIVNVGKAKDFCDISSWGITCILVHLKEGPVFIRPSSRGAIKQIVHELDVAIKACDVKKTPVRKDRLEALKAKFSEILNSPEFQRVAERQEATAQDAES